jgi:uncharacterized protein (DUF736 family)
MGVTNKMEEQNKSIGVMWEKVSKAKGTKYMSGNLEILGTKVSIVMFKNNKKKIGSNEPDWRILLSQKLDEKQRTIETEDVENI